MSTSGTYTYNLQAQDIYSAALRLTGAFGDGDTIPSSDMANVAQAFNLLIKSMAIKAEPLWCLQDVAVPTVQGQAQYNLSTITSMPLPLRIKQVFLRDASGNDVTMAPLSRTDYNTLGMKSSQGVPTQYYYNPQLNAGVITVYNTPADSTHTMHILVQRQIQDVNLLTDNVDFPQEALRMLKFALADDISLEYLAPPDVRSELNQRASALKEEFFSSCYVQEQVSVYFTPSERTM